MITTGNVTIKATNLSFNTRRAIRSDVASRQSEHFVNLSAKVWNVSVIPFCFVKDTNAVISYANEAVIDE